LLAYKQKVLAPGFVAEGGALAHDFLNANVARRETWLYLYSRDLRRVLQTPSSGYDNPAPNSDALRFNDESDMYNGSSSLYN
jgi:hypothetical protein